MFVRVHTAVEKLDTAAASHSSQQNTTSVVTSCWDHLSSAVNSLQASCTALGAATPQQQQSCSQIMARIVSTRLSAELSRRGSAQSKPLPHVTMLGIDSHQAAHYCQQQNSNQMRRQQQQQLDNSTEDGVMHDDDAAGAAACTDGSYSSIEGQGAEGGLMCHSIENHKSSSTFRSSINRVERKRPISAVLAVDGIDGSSSESSDRVQQVEEEVEYEG